MANIIDYLKWRGDISFKVSKFNEVDNIIFERISYFPLERLMKNDERISLKELSKRFNDKGSEKVKVYWDADIELISLIGKNIRFKNLEVSDFEKIQNKAIQEQFAAATIHLNDERMYLSFRGTDATLIGWKEDFNLAFMSHVGSQVSAKEYLEKIANKYPNKKIILGGHSKGGNIAIYASVFASNDIKKRIIGVYSNDGPGFEKIIANSKEYNAMSSKIITYIPQNSIIGMAMNHNEKIVIIKSNEKGLMQHDVYSWQVNRNSLVKENQLTKLSVYIDKTVSEWLEYASIETRKEVIDTIFDIIAKTGIDSFKEFKNKRFENVLTILKSYKNLDSDTRKKMINAVTDLMKIASSNVSSLVVLNKNNSKIN